MEFKEVLLSYIRDKAKDGKHQITKNKRSVVKYIRELIDEGCDDFELTLSNDLKSFTKTSWLDNKPVQVSKYDLIKAYRKTKEEENEQCSENECNKSSIKTNL